jgi:hypothetical protein
MCFGGSSGDGGAAATQAKLDKQEAEKQARIKQGQASIDDIFAQFSPDFFNQYQNDYADAQRGDLDYQYGKAKDKLTATLAGRGTLESTVGASKLADLERQNTQTLGEIGNTSVNAANDFRNKVEGQKSDLYTLNQSTADPDTIAARATGEATALVPPKPTSTLGDIFGSVLGSLGNATKGAVYSPYGTRLSSYFTSPSGTGSGRVVS